MNECRLCGKKLKSVYKDIVYMDVTPHCFIMVCRNCFDFIEAYKKNGEILEKYKRIYRKCLLEAGKNAEER